MNVDFPSNETIAKLCNNLVQGNALAVGFQPKDGKQTLKFAAECYSGGGAIQLLILFDHPGQSATRENADMAAAAFLEKYGDQMDENCIWVYEDRLNPEPRQAAYFFAVTLKENSLKRHPLGVLPRVIFRALLDRSADRQMPPRVRELLNKDNQQFLSQWFDDDVVP